MEYKYVDQNIKVHTGDEAKKRLDKHNDAKFLSEDGIVSVSSDRWKEAQVYEYKTWMKQCRNFKDDHNIENLSHFENFDRIKFDKVERVLELGCGPFTNVRLLTDRLPNVKSIHLLDPLADEYLNHPNCTYKDKKLNGKDVILHSSSIEDSNINETFDLIILVNVLEHCQDINIIFDKIGKLLNDGGYFVFADVVFNPDYIKNEIATARYNSGHPIRVSYDYIDEHLSDYSQLYLNKTEHKLMDAQYYYYIGRKI